MHAGGGNKAICYVDIYNSMQSHVTADFILEAQVLAYSNPTHFASAFNASDFGQCCDRSDSPPTCTVPSFCDNSFTFCFREAGRRDINTAEDDGSNCPYGRSTTDLIQRNNDNLTFTVGETFPGEVPNPVTAFGQIWPVSKRLCCIHNYVAILV